MKNISNGKSNFKYARLTKAERTKSRSLLIEIFKKNQKIKSHTFSLYYVFKSANYSPRTIFGISIPKKVAPKAFHRNRIKRLFKHAWQSIKTTISLMIPEDIVLCCFVMVHINSCFTFHEIQKELETVFSKLLLNLPHAEN